MVSTARGGPPVKRFIDLGAQVIEGAREFAFYDTITDRFEDFGGEQAWATWDEFAEVCSGDRERYRALCPPWVFGPEARP